MILRDKRMQELKYLKIMFKKMNLFLFIFLHVNKNEKQTLIMALSIDLPYINRNLHNVINLDKLCNDASQTDLLDETLTDYFTYLIFEINTTKGRDAYKYKLAYMYSTIIANDNDDIEKIKEINQTQGFNSCQMIITRTYGWCLTMNDCYHGINKLINNAEHFKSLFKLNYPAMHESNKAFADELAQAVFHPLRLERQAERCGLTFLEVEQMY